MIMFLFRKVRKILSLKFLFFSIFHQLQDVQSEIYTKLPQTPTTIFSQDIFLALEPITNHLDMLVMQ